MKEITYADIVTPELLLGAIENNEFEGFKADYHVLHCLLRTHKPKRFFEIGCNLGRGTKIIKNALGPDSTVFSLDLPLELAHISLQHPTNEGHGDRVGHLCDLPFTLVRGDSMTYDYSQHYPIDGWFCDGEHETPNVYKETLEMLKSLSKIIVYHDTDLPQVMEGIKRGVEDSENGGRYDLYRVLGTRISYLLLNK